MKIALIGGTGLVGGLLAPLLLERGHEVHALQRRAMGLRHPGLRETVAPAEQWPDLLAGSEPQVAISALGTTMRQAGSMEAFRAVDFDLVVGFARAARDAGARHFIAISSVGADPRSRNFYLGLKGEMEEALVGFDRLDLLRPGLLRGPRGGERRRGERIGIALAPIVNLALRGRLDRYAAIDARIVAAAAAALVEKSETGRFVHHNRDLRRAASAAPLQTPPGLS